MTIVRDTHTWCHQMQWAILIRHLQGAAIIRLLQIIGLFCSISSLLWGSFTKETNDFKEPPNRSHPPISCVGCNGLYSIQSYLHTFPTPTYKTWYIICSLHSRIIRYKKRLYSAKEPYRLYSAKETYGFKEPTHRSHPIDDTIHLLRTIIYVYVSLHTSLTILYANYMSL